MTIKGGLNQSMLSRRQCGMTAVAMVAAATGATWLTPREELLAVWPDLESSIPKAFGDWRALPDGMAQIAVAQGVDTTQEQPYDQVLMRTYANGQGEQVMLALAWGRRQRQDVKVHRPEVCYPAQGYRVISSQPGSPVQADLPEPIPTVALLTQMSGSYEAVLYWIRIGGRYGGDGWAMRRYLFTEGLEGRIPDGVLVRASQRLPRAELWNVSQQTMRHFLEQLVMALSASIRPLLAR